MKVGMCSSRWFFTCCLTVFSVVSSTQRSGTWYEEVATNQSASCLIDSHMPVSNKYFHRCSLKETCNFVVQNIATDKFSEAAAITELPNGKECYRIWKKVRQQPENIKSCKHLRDIGITKNGVYNILLDSGKTVRASCDMNSNGGGWTIFQRRIDANTNFVRNWTEYASGFGNPEGNFWLGLEAIHQLTKDKNVSLRFDLKHQDGSSGHAEYANFSVGGEMEKFKIDFGQYKGNIGDSMKESNGMMFSTEDKDNDKALKNCSKVYQGAWWHNLCFFANLNNLYPTFNSTVELYSFMTWKTWKNSYGGIIFSEIKLRTK